VLHSTAPEVYGDTRLPERFWIKVFPCPFTGCWLWGAGENKNGYGRWQPVRGRQEFVHRAVVRIFRGPIPRGMHVDHLCRVRSCCNPDHLEVVTARENCHRGDSPWAANWRKTHCINGHEFDKENTYWEASQYPGSVAKRRCRACGRERKRKSMGYSQLGAKYRTYCPQGHEYAGRNLVVHGGRRHCRTCRNAYRRRLYAAHKTA
jgi:HNH endonuclease